MTDVVSPPAEFSKHRLATEARFDAARIEQCAIAGHHVTLASDPDVFRPTLTTSFLTEQVLLDDVAGLRALDLGCGVGPIAIVLAKAGAKHVLAIDLMPRACELALFNAEINGVADRVTVSQGDLFSPAVGKKFEVIVDDVSGVADTVARLSRWFPRDVPLAGHDGSLLTVRMLRSASEHLTPGGKLFFPVLSLSNRMRILEAGSAVFDGRLECVAKKQVPFSPELKANLPTLVELRERGIIHFDEVRSRCFWTLEIYRALGAS